jgi:hypothetical protein
MLGLPHAHYEVARWRDTVGVVTPGFTSEGLDLVHGNELLAERDPSYPSEGRRYIRTQQHTIEPVRAVVGDARVGLPPHWEAPAGIDSAAGVFGGYLLLDAWIGNTDRHHANWGLVVRQNADVRYLAPTFDHASSLGAHERDATRSRRLESPDPGFQVEGYVRRSIVRSALYRDTADPRPLGLIDAFLAWREHSACESWLDRLEAVSDGGVSEVLARIPPTEASGPALAFARAILRVNRRRILEVR